MNVYDPYGYYQTTGLYGGIFKDTQNQLYIVDDPMSLNLYTYCQNNPIRFIDPSGNWIVGLGGTVTIAVVAGASLQGALAVDSYGNVGILIIGGLGGAIPQASAALNGFFSWRDSIFNMGYDMIGKPQATIGDMLSGTIGAGADVGYSVGIDVLYDLKGPSGIQISAGIGISLVVEFHDFLALPALIPLYISDSYHSKMSSSSIDEIMNFQKLLGIKQTGIYDDNTQKALIELQIAGQMALNPNLTRDDFLPNGWLKPLPPGSRPW
jgi:hypothetical protein